MPDTITTTPSVDSTSQSTDELVKAFILALRGNNPNNELKKLTTTLEVETAKAIIVGAFTELANTRVPWRTTNIVSLARRQLRGMSQISGLIDLL